MPRSLYASRRVAVALVVALVLALTSVVASADGATAASPRKCKVFNTTQGYTRGNLQAAVDTAEPGDTLKVRGICHGATVIRDKDLTIIGIRKPGSGRPTLDGKFRRPVLQIGGADRLTVFVEVKIRNLTIQDGRQGISVPTDARVVLKDVMVRRNWDGGVGHSQRVLLWLRGSTVIRGNTGDLGGGVSCGGVVYLQGRSTIKHNVSTGTGNFGGGGGLWADDHCTVYMSGQSSIHHNVASAGNAGGIYYRNAEGPPPIVKGAVCGIGGNVHHNYPSDCNW